MMKLGGKIFSRDIIKTLGQCQDLNSQPSTPCSSITKLLPIVS